MRNDMEPARMSYWNTADGRIISIEDMTDTHIINALRLMKKVAVKKFPDRWTDEVPLQFFVLMRAAEKRGLEYDPFNDIYEKIRIHKLRRKKLDGDRKIIKNYSDSLSKPREVDLDN